MVKRDKIFWHEAHVEALELELYEYKDILEFDGEYRLSKEALRVDVLVIKKTKDVQIEKNIGKLFKGHNLFEYKSESDSFSTWDYHKILGYAFLHAAFKKIPLSDITMSVSLTIFPREAVAFLQNECGLTIHDNGDGIYYVEGSAVSMQILESKRLDEDENLFLHNLRSNLSADDVQKTLRTYEKRKPLDSKSPFWDRIVKANYNSFMEAMSMFSDDLKELFLEGAEVNGWFTDRDEKLINEGIAQGVTQGIAQGVTQGIAQGVTQGITQGVNKVLELIKSGVDPDEAARRVTCECNDILELDSEHRIK